MTQYFPVRRLAQPLPPEKRFTPLAPLEPMGLGTDDVESLTSLLSRLSTAHSLPIKSLLEAVYGSHPTQEAEWHVNMNAAYLVDLGGNYTDKIVPALEHLMGRDDLSRMTFSALRSVLDHQGHHLLAKHFSWCPHCFQEDDEKQRPRYVRLWWTAASATVCPKHSVLLASACTHCGSKQSVTAANDDFTVCSSCGMPLIETEVAQCTERSLKREYWITNSIRQLTGDIGSGRLMPLKPDVLARAIKDLVADVAGGNCAGFGRLLCWQATSYRDWAKGVTKPSFASVMELCYRVDIPVSELLRRTGNMPNIVISRCQSRPKKVNRNVESSVRKELVSRHITTIQESQATDSGVPWTRKSLALELGVSPGYLKYNFPELCKQLEVGRRGWQQEKRERSAIKRRLQAREVIDRLKRNGVYPSDRNILKDGALSFGDLRAQEVKDLLVVAKQSCRDST